MVPAQQDQHEICNVVFRMVISMLCFYDLNTTFSASKAIIKLNCVFISYTLQRLPDLVANLQQKHCFIEKMPLKMTSYSAENLFELLC